MTAVFAVLATSFLALPALGAGTASADPIIDSGDVLQRVTSPDGSFISSVEIAQGPLYTPGQALKITIHSAAMDKDVLLEVQRPADVSKPRPVLYLLNGGGGGQDGATWRLNTDAYQWLADKNVNVVTPIGGAFSYYTDWRSPDPHLGVNKWKTFLTEEIPPILDKALGTNGKNAIAGLSTSGTSVLALPIAAPGLYQSTAAYSGCAQTSDPLGQAAVNVTVNVWGGGNTVNMYGDANDPLWRENDPVVNAEGLRGLTIYVASGSGLPGQYDTLDGPRSLRGSEGLASQVAVGGGIEAATDYCSRNLQTRLNELAIPAHFNLGKNGTHSWGYWEDDLKDSWPIISAPLGI